MLRHGFTILARTASAVTGASGATVSATSLIITAVMTCKAKRNRLRQTVAPNLDFALRITNTSHEGGDYSRALRLPLLVTF